MLVRRVLLPMRSFARRLIGAPQPLQGRYSDWAAACRESTGYDQPVILQRLIAATEEVIASGGQKHERDGVVFDEPVTPFPLLSFLLQAAGRSDNRLTALDFGGSLGSTYRQCQPFFSHLEFVHWNVVEQGQVAAIGRSRFQDGRLQFHSRIDEALANGPPNVAVLSGVLQYLDEPYRILAELAACRPSLIVVDRNPFSNSNDDAFSLQVVSDAIFPARLAFRIFGADSLERTLFPAYRKIAEFDTVDPDMMAGSLKVQFRGKVFERVVER